jgi:hypothetical protein
VASLHRSNFHQTRWKAEFIPGARKCMRRKRGFVFRETKGFETVQLHGEFGEHKLSLGGKAPTRPLTKPSDCRRFCGRTVFFARPRLRSHGLKVLLRQPNTQHTVSNLNR